jgi:hypothetical protein
MAKLKLKTNFIIDILMFLCLSAMAGIGLLMKYILIPGKDRVLVYGRNVELYFWDLDRHQWGTVHLIVSLCMLGLLGIHIILHWKAVIAQFKCWFAKKSIRRVLTVIFVIICIVLVYFPFRINPEVEDFEGGRGRYYMERHGVETLQPSKQDEEVEQSADTEMEIERPVPEEAEAIEVQPEEPAVGEEHDSAIDVQGFMTLKEVSENYQVPTSHIKSKLGIPLSVSDNERLGRLRRTYGFTMSEVRDIIIAYKNTQK